MQLKINKIESLTEQQRQEVQVFVDSLLKKTEIDFDSRKYKRKLSKVSTWTDTELSIFDKNKKLFKKWIPATW